MAITKQIVDSNTGVPLNYHVILTMQIDFNNKVVYATLASYFSRDAYESGLRPLAQNTVMLPGVPGQNEDNIDWAQNLLIAAVDESVNTNQYQGRWLFSDGAAADRAPVAVVQPAAAPAITEQHAAVDPSVTPAITEEQAKADPATAQASATDAAASGDAAQTA